MKSRVPAVSLLVALVCALCLLPTQKAFGQTVYGSIYGTVTDSTGAAIPGATITVTDVQKGVSVKVQSNASGDYQVQHLIPDTYDVKVEYTGFKAFVQTNNKVFSDASLKIDASLAAGGTSQTVQVNANAVPLLKTEHTDVATQLSEKEVQDLPVSGRNFTDLELLIPGAQLLPWSHAADENPQASAQIQIDGQAFGGVAYSLDGTDNQDPILGIIVINPGLNSITESKIATQNYDAEFGKAVAAFVTVQTKSGSNQYHGSLFDYRTSTANLAKDPYSQYPGAVFPPGLKNVYGGSLGGRIIRDKLFAFGDYQATRSRVGTSASTLVPTAHIMSTCLGNSVASNGIAGCDFSEYKPLGFGVYENVGGVATEYPGDVIPTGQLSQQALNYLNLISQFAPNKSSGVGPFLDTYTQGGTGLFNADQWDVRVDDQVTSGSHAFVRFSRFTDTLSGTVLLGVGGGPGFGIGGYGGNSQGHNDSLAAGMDIAVNPKLLTDFRIGYYRYNIGDSKFDESTTEMNTLGWGGLNISGQPITNGLAGFQIHMPNGGQTEWGAGLNINRCNCPLTEQENQLQFVNNWTKIIGNHTAKVGVDLRFAHNLRVPSDTDRTGLFDFNAAATAAGDGSGGLGLASFMLGEPDNFGRYVSTSTNAREFQKRFFFYGQDTWRATPKLTVNYGTRYEYYSPESVNGDGNGALMDLKTGYLHVAGVGKNNLSMGWQAAKNTWNPRLGISYQFNEKTVVRAGYGRSFDLGVFGSIFGHVVTQNLPVLANQSISSTGNNAVNYTAPFDLATGPPALTPITVPSNGLLPNPGYAVNTKARPNPLRLPTLDAWNLSVQRSISSTMTVTVAYVGNKGTHTLSSGDGNNTNPNEAAIFLPAQYSVTGAALHYDPNGGNCWPAGPNCTNPIPASGAVSNSNFLRRYYGGSLAACQDANYAQPTGEGLPAGACGWTQGISYYGDDQDTHYNALQITVAKQFAHGLQFNSSYAYAHAINYASSYATWNKAPERGNDDFVRHSEWVTYGIYQLPFGHNGRYLASAPRAVDEVVGGWQISPIINISSGLPFTLGMSQCSSSVGATSAPCYPNGSSGSLHTNISKFDAGNHRRLFYHNVEGDGSPNTLCPSSTDPTGHPAGGFTCPALDQIGNGGRNNAFGPGLWNVDAALQKDFPIHESLLAQFRVDFFNLFNHINPGNPNTGNVDATDGGFITSGQPGNAEGPPGTSSPRQLQFSLSIQF